MIYLVSMQNPFVDTNGVACHIQDLYKGIRAQNQDISVLSPFLENDFQSRILLKFQNLFSRIYSILSKKNAFFRKYISEWIFFIKIQFTIQILTRKIRNIKNSDSAINCEDILSLISLKKSKRLFKKMIYTLHFNSEPEKEFLDAGYFRSDSICYSLFKKMVYSAYQIDALNLVSVSSFPENLYKKFFPEHKKWNQCFRIIYPGLQVSYQKSEVLQEKISKFGDYIVNVGKITDIKNQLFLAEIAFHLKKLGVCPKFVLVGEFQKEYFEKLQKFISEKDLHDQFIFTGSVSRSEVFQLVQSARMNLHCAKMESFGMVVVEAIALNCPVLVCSYPAIREIIGTIPESILDPSENFPGLAEKIRLIYQDRETLKSIQSRQYLEFEKKFQFSVMIQSFLEEYGFKGDFS